MKPTLLKTENARRGFWGTYARSGYGDTEIGWTAASDFFRDTFGLTPTQVRDLLDSRFGRHLADDLSFIDGPITAETITAHLQRRLNQRSFRQWFERAVAEIRAG